LKRDRNRRKGSNLWFHGIRSPPAYSRVLLDTYLVSADERTGKLPFLVGYDTFSDYGLTAPVTKNAKN